MYTWKYEMTISLILIMNQRIDLFMEIWWIFPWIKLCANSFFWIDIYVRIWLSAWIYSWKYSLGCRCKYVYCSVLQCVAVCCSVLQCVAVCCSVLQCVAVCCSEWYVIDVRHLDLHTFIYMHTSIYIHTSICSFACTNLHLYPESHSYSHQLT